MSHSKILVTFKNDDDEYQIESVWAIKEGDNYRIDNIPFLAPNIALNDIISVEEEDGALYFDSLVEPSGHTTLQIVVFDESNVSGIVKELERFGCSWEGSHLKTLISVDVPKDVDYAPIKKYLVENEKENILSYKEACLSHGY